MPFPQAPQEPPKLIVTDASVRRPITPAALPEEAELEASFEVPEEVRDLQALWQKIEMEERAEAERLANIVPWQIPLEPPDETRSASAESAFFKQYVDVKGFSRESSFSASSSRTSRNWRATSSFLIENGVRFGRCSALSISSVSAKSRSDPLAD